jgi:hypothetical protein
MTTSDELADALLLDWDASLDNPGRERFRNELRALVRDAAKQALLDAAKDYEANGLPARRLLDRAEQIGTRDGD